MMVQNGWDRVALRVRVHDHVFAVASNVRAAEMRQRSQSADRGAIYDVALII